MGKKSKAQINVEYAAARVLLGIVGLLPRSVATALGSCAGKLAYRLLGKLRRTGERNLELALPELSKAERDKILMGSLSSLGRSLGIFPQLKKITRKNLHEFVDIVGSGNFDAVSSNGRGTLFITGHLGNWELLPVAFALNYSPANMLVRRLDNPKIEELVDEVRTLHGNRTLDKRAAARDMMRLLNDGKIIGVLIDSNADLREGVFVDFFGIPACTTAGAASLALRTNANVLPFFMVWDKASGKYQMKIEPPIDFISNGDKEKDRIELTVLMTNAIEKFVRKYPEQWLWIHRRWKTRPQGEPDLYKKV